MIVVDRYGNKFYGLPDWMKEEIEVKYECTAYGGSYDPLFGALGEIRCVGMGGARVAYTHEVPCITKDRKPLIINRDVVDESLLPIVCGYRRIKGWDKGFVDKADVLFKEAEGVKCPGRHCVVLDKKIIMVGDLDVILDWLVYRLKTRRITGYPVII